MGHKITANLVYFLKGKSAAKKARKKRVVKAAKAASSNGAVSKSEAIGLAINVQIVVAPVIIQGSCCSVSQINFFGLLSQKDRAVPSLDDRESAFR